MTFGELVELWKLEVLSSATKKIKLRRLFRRLREKELPHYLFWFRLGQYLHRKPKGWFNCQRIARRIHTRLLRTHGIEIGVEAQIGPGLHIGHRVGVVINGCVKIGRNFHIRQNTTIGVQHDTQPGVIIIGNDVVVGANSCIIGNRLSIGDRAVIGAMSFVNKDIPADTTFYTTHVPNVRPHPDAPSVGQ